MLINHLHVNWKKTDHSLEPNPLQLSFIFTELLKKWLT
jgi:hypothetical protein